MKTSEVPKFRCTTQLAGVVILVSSLLMAFAIVWHELQFLSLSLAATSVLGIWFGLSLFLEFLINLVANWCRLGPNLLFQIDKSRIAAFEEALEETERQKTWLRRHEHLKQKEARGDGDNDA